ncbi:unnamed protein product [Prunus armeniaca]|uniref:Major facilitator superfamily (MFS) profile domain-containing protein n=1 Tax=Prunus armeniaca TaxID=36596 RepID=A0A6J5WC53_PRUAR|nr:unnamed protein product [Prunus armeniaca]
MNPHLLTSPSNNVQTVCTNLPLRDRTTQVARRIQHRLAVLHRNRGGGLQLHINYATSKHSWGWRLSLRLAIVPATIMTTGALFISDSPTSLVQRNRLDQARKSLIKIRGKEDIEAELAQLRQYRPQLVIGAIAMPFFQQVTGINIIAFYAPVLFQSVGFGNDSALIASIILGLVNLGSTLVSTYMVDRHGRRFLFMEGGIRMVICQVAVAIVLAATTGTDGNEHISKGYAILVLVLMCIYAAGFGWSWRGVL